MCGILGIISARPHAPESSVKRLLRLLEHRGPDGEGLWRSKQGPPFVTLGHRRLAVIDLSAEAAQPMADTSGSLWLTYNGEIYNYLELMAELEAKGHRFRTRSDTEVLLCAYKEWGTGCLERLNGMFAFALWDVGRRELFAARDRFGEKPFHYAWLPAQGLFAFASEIKALLPLPWVDGGLHDRALYRFVAFQELAGAEQTLFRGVRRLPHAHWLRLAWNGASFTLSTARYWDVDLERTSSLSLDAAATQLGELFADSVRLRLRADVPVGTSLSGGLDSSAVVCQIHKLGAAAGQKTFSARMEDPALDEGPHIAQVLRRTGVQGQEVWPAAEKLADCFPRLCYHQEEPFLSTSQFAQHLVMELAQEHGVTVLLDGQGADELLAGYTPYFLVRYAELARQWRLVALYREWRGFRARHPRPFPLRSRALAVRLFPWLPRASRARAPIASLIWGEMTPWWSVDWLAGFDREQPIAPPASRRDTLTLRLYSDALQGELQELLRYGDRNSMAFSRELRQPFLDHRIAEFLFSLPVEYKLRSGETKLVLRRALTGLIPDANLTRQDKLGYQAPLADWLRGPLLSWAARILEQASASTDGRVSPEAPSKLRQLGERLTEAEARALFSVLTAVESLQQLRGLRATQEVLA